MLILGIYFIYTNYAPQLKQTKNIFDFYSETGKKNTFQAL